MSQLYLVIFQLELKMNYLNYMRIYQLYMLKVSKDLNINLIESKYLQLKDKKFNFEKLFLDHWRNKLNLDFKNNFLILKILQ